MKVILAAVNAKYIHSNLAVFSLRAYAAQHGQEAEIAEYTINHQPEHILMDLYKRKPDVLAFSCYIWNFEMILESWRRSFPFCVRRRTSGWAARRCLGMRRSCWSDIHSCVG